jgi:hypothetical protein
MEETGLVIPSISLFRSITRLSRQRARELICRRYYVLLGQFLRGRFDFRSEAALICVIGCLCGSGIIMDYIGYGTQAVVKFLKRTKQFTSIKNKE